jgi:hypothetical protein
VYYQHGGAAIINRRTNIGNMTVGEHGKPELLTVTPLTSRTGDVADKKIALSNKLKEAFGRGDNKRMAKGKGGGKQEIRVRGEVYENTPLTVYIDGQVVNQSVQRRLLRFSDASK